MRGVRGLGVRRGYCSEGSEGLGVRRGYCSEGIGCEEGLL